MEKQIRKLNAEMRELCKNQNLLMNNRTNMSEDEFFTRMYESNNEKIGLIGKILDYHQRRKVECAFGVPLEYYDELINDPIVRRKHLELGNMLLAKDKEEDFEYEARFLHDAFLTLVFIGGFDLTDLESLPQDGIINLYLDGYDPENHGKTPDLSKYK